MSVNAHFSIFAERRLGKEFAAKHLTVRGVSAQSAEEFCERAAAVHADLRRLAERVGQEMRKSAKQSYMRDLARARGLPALERKKQFSKALAEHQDDQHAITVILFQEKERCAREWSALALTTLVYATYVSQSPYSRLCDAPLAVMEIWLRDLNNNLAPAMEARHCFVGDVSVVFERALLDRHVEFLPCTLQTNQAGLLQSMSAQDFQHFAVQNPTAAAKHVRRASRVCMEKTLSSEQVSKGGNELAHYAKMCCEQLSHFVTGMTNRADRFNLSGQNLLVLWRCYFFVVLQRGGVSMSENPYTEHVRAQVDLFTQYAPLRASVMALRTRVETCLQDWERDNVFACGAELRALWTLHCDFLLQGLEAAHFLHRMVRQKMAQSIAETFLVPCSDGYTIATVDANGKHRTPQGAILQPTASGKWRRLADAHE